ncbi:hypothetical protein C0580_03155 [Candidatus Parcubacteria bacterium]|nr:MAG: hypothetical protein C0580_03155 [Candidatus Parcubacteria bacterium]
MHKLFLGKPQFQVEKMQAQKTPYGGPVIYYRISFYQDDKKIELYFLSRHECTGIYRLPHMLDHRLYMYTLMCVVGVDCILATSAVGAIGAPTTHYKQGDITAPRFAVDYVGDPYTFATPMYTHPTAFHRPATWLFCPHVQKLLASSVGAVSNVILANSIKGPRFETLQEMDQRKRDKAYLVGMTTAFPEAILAGEGAVPYGLLCGVANLAPASEDGREVGEVMAQMQEPILNSILRVSQKILEDGLAHPKNCPCRQGREESVFSILGKPSF